MKKLRAGLVVAALLTIAWATSPSNLRADDAPGVESHPWIGEAAPAFDLEQVGGGRLSLEGLKGKFVVIHFGASW